MSWSGVFKGYELFIFLEDIGPGFCLHFHHLSESLLSAVLWYLFIYIHDENHSHLLLLFQVVDAADNLPYSGQGLSSQPCVGNFSKMFPLLLSQTPHLLTPHNTWEIKYVHKSFNYNCRNEKIQKRKKVYLIYVLLTKKKTLMLTSDFQDIEEQGQTLTVRSKQVPSLSLHNRFIKKRESHS